ncbi:hypothetical protein NW754_016277 [Fusarium falciforme]|nr:hypothetical protein NW754_016277 [Fusarium falciforme]
MRGVIPQILHSQAHAESTTFHGYSEKRRYGEREEWHIAASKSLEDRISAVTAPKRGKSRKGKDVFYRKPNPDPEEIRRVNHEAALDDIRRKKLNKLLRQKEKLEARIQKQSLDQLIAEAARKRVEEERMVRSLRERIEPPKKSLLERVEELRMPAEWVEKRGLANPRDVHCTEKKWDWFLDVDKQMNAAHKNLFRLWKVPDATTTAPIIAKFTTLITDFDDLSTHLEQRVRQDSMKNEDLRRLEKYLRRVEHVFGDLDVKQHVTYLKTHLVHSGLNFDLGKPQL